MKLFLAGTKAYESLVRKYRPAYVLESFMYISRWQIEYMGECKAFMLDSGGFTFLNAMQKRKKTAVMDWRSYVDRYGDFVKGHGVKLFFEMDVDVFVGHSEVLKLTERLERRAGRQCIPIWHYNRGSDEYFRLCKDYPYIAYGGLVTGEVPLTVFPYLNKLVDAAHDRGAEVHGLGITRDLRRFRMDSVDSTTWQNAARYGNLTTFDGNGISRQIRRGDGYRNKMPADERMEVAFREWVKYQQYLDQDRL